MTESNLEKKASAMDYVLPAGLLGAAALTGNYEMVRDQAVYGASLAGAQGIIDVKEGKKPSMKKSLEEMLVGTATAPVTHTCYKLMNTIPLETAAGAIDYTGLALRSFVNIPVYVPLINTVYLTLDHLVKKKTFKGLYKETLKPRFWESTKKVMTRLGPLFIANALFIPPGFQVPIVAGLTFAYKMLMSSTEKKAAYATQHAAQA